MGFPGGTVLKNPPANAGYAGWTPGLGRHPGGAMATHSSILARSISRTEEYSCQENPMDRGAWQATVHGVTKELDTTY